MTQPSDSPFRSYLDRADRPSVELCDPEVGSSKMLYKIEVNLSAPEWLSNQRTFLIHVSGMASRGALKEEHEAFGNDVPYLIGHPLYSASEVELIHLLVSLLCESRVSS